MNPSEEKENELLGAIEEVAPQENIPYDEEDDGIELESDNQNDAESNFFPHKLKFSKRISRKSFMKAKTMKKT